MKQKILFLCTGNSCRSQMAEAWTRYLKNDILEPCSAGVNPGIMDIKAVREVTGNNIPILHRIFVRIQGVIMKEYWNLPSLLQRRIRAKRQVRCVDYFL